MTTELIAALEAAEGPSRKVFLTPDALVELRYIASSGRLYAPIANEMLRKDQDARKSALRAGEA